VDLLRGGIEVSDEIWDGEEAGKTVKEFLGEVIGGHA